MDAIIVGDGPLGRAIAAALVDAGHEAPTLVGRPERGAHPATLFRDRDVVFEASRGDAVASNVAAAVAAGVRRLVIATTGWDDSRPELEALLRGHSVAAVAAPNFSLGVALFLRLVDEAALLFGSLDSFEPYVVEWHRRAKRDRPSGTAREIGRRLVTTHRLKHRLADPAAPGPPAPDQLEIAAIRAGSSPGMHLVGFDAPGESIELRVTARDRSAYTAGALAAAEWLMAGERPPGIHAFDVVVDELIDRHPPIALTA